MLWDSTILGVLLITLASLTSLLPFESSVLRGLLIFLPVLSFEPLFIYFRGSTIGHQLAGIKVININEQKQLSIVQCYVRSIVKLLLGAFSLIMFVFSKNYQAIHDYASLTMVVFIDEHITPQNHKLTHQRNVFTDNKPSLGRRLTIIIVWLMILWSINSLVFTALLSESCYQYNQCSSSEELIFQVNGLIFFATLLIIPVLGFMCKLPGAFYKPLKM